MQRVAKRGSRTLFQVERAAAAAAWSDGDSVRVLVIDSSAGLRKLFALELEEAGYATVGADSPRAAMQLAVDDPPDAIVLDASTAPDAGSALLRALRSEARLRGVPVVTIACVAGAEQRLLEAGADCCLRRIPARGELLKAVAWVLSVYGDRRSA